MTWQEAGAATLAAVSGGAAAMAAAIVLVPRAPGRLMRTNVSGRPVPAVLGWPLFAGAVAGKLVAALFAVTAWSSTGVADVLLAIALVVLLGAGGGLLDDLQGDETARGFRGHAAAVAKGRLTGGVLKVALIGVAGLGAGALTGRGWYVIECALLVALSANLINLLDRAPGRAVKVGLLWGLVLVISAPGVWTLGCAGLLGGAAACLPLDLREQAMLGDAGANPIGAALGLGLALSLDRPGRLVALGLLVALTAASELWSFSRVIERTPGLRAADRLGRRRTAVEK